MALTRAALAALAALAVCPLARAVATEQSAPEPTEAAAQRAYAAGDYDRARTMWSALAERGDPSAELGLGALYDLGQGVARDSATAFRWYRRAAMAGLAEAEFDVAVMRDGGIGVAHDTARAALWYARAASHGDARAAFNLGQLYQAGEGVPRNPQVAAAWLRASDLPAARARLAGIPPAAASDGALAGVNLAAPQDGSSVAAAPGRAVELVWIAPAQRMPVRFFVQVMAMEPLGALREVFSGELETTATLAPLPPGRYAWRVYTVAGDHYAASAWARFAVANRTDDQVSAR